MDRNRNKPVIPTREEAKKIIPMIRAEFAKAGADPISVGEQPLGGVMARATIPDEGRDGFVSALFGNGIVPVEIRAGEWAFAIRR